MDQQRIPAWHEEAEPLPASEPAPEPAQPTRWDEAAPTCAPVALFPRADADTCYGAAEDYLGI